MTDKPLPAGVPELDPLPLVIVSADRPAWTDDQLRDIYALGARRGYEAGKVQERALWELSASSQEIEAADAAQGGEAVKVKLTDIAERKVRYLIAEGYTPVGYVMEKDGARNAVTCRAAVAWLTDQELSTLLFVDGRVITHPAPAAPAVPMDWLVGMAECWEKNAGESEAEGWHTEASAYKTCAADMRRAIRRAAAPLPAAPAGKEGGNG